jgi:S1-C subfamily serine protease
VGTGLLIARRATGTGLDAGIVLTAAHVVNAPDTVRAYLWDAKGQPTGALASISVKVSDFVFITGRGGANAGASVRKLDLEHDLAMLTTSIPVGNRTLSDFDFRIGSASDLDWGNFVYLIGYPHGQAQLTWGLVSRGDGEEEFMAGATINFGYSGGPVLAVRDDLPNLELVGICRGASTNKLRYLAPSDLLEEGVTMTPHLLGQTTVRETRQIEYGTAFVIPVERIRSFVLDGRDIFTEKGIDVFSHPPLRTWGF